MIAKIKAGQNPGIPTYLTEKAFCELFHKNVGEWSYCTSPTAVEWAGNGRLGSHWRVNQDMYVKVKDETDDPMNYYKIPDAPKGGGGAPWGGSSCCGGTRGNCGSSGRCC